MTGQLTIEEVNALDEPGFVARFGGVLEDSPHLARRAWRYGPFRDVGDLARAFRDAMYAASEGERLNLVRAHPDLAGKAAVAGELSSESAGEQASAGLDRLSPEQYEAFTAMNAAYREKFGIPMIVCVREHTRESILENAEARLENTPEEELRTALGEISKIAELRLRDLVEAEGDREMAGEVVLGRTGYGKSGVRLVKVIRGPERHDLIDLDVAVALEGDFEAAHVRGDNTDLLATDTMRNTVYALAKDHLTGSVEEFGLKLVDHFLEAGPTVERATVRFTEYPWSRIRAEGRDHPHSFVRDAGERRAEVSGDTAGARAVEAGLGNLLVMKTTQSGWKDFFRDRYTTLPDTDDRILATVVDARWSYASTAGLDFDALWTGVRDRILATFTDHYSPSVQNTLYRIGAAVLEAFDEVEKIHLSFPNKHHLPYDLARFGLENENEIFQATEEPYGLIEGTVERRP